MDGYILTCSASGGNIVRFTRQTVTSVSKSGSISYISGTSTTGLVNSKVWQSGTGMAGTMYSSSTYVRAYNDDVFGSTENTEIHALYS